MRHSWHATKGRQTFRIIQHEQTMQTNNKEHTRNMQRSCSVKAAVTAIARFCFKSVSPSIFAVCLCRQTKVRKRNKQNEKQTSKHNRAVNAARDKTTKRSKNNKQGEFSPERSNNRLAPMTREALNHMGTQHRSVHAQCRRHEYLRT